MQVRTSLKSDLGKWPRLVKGGPILVPVQQRSRNDLREADFNGVFSAAIEKPPKAFTAILD